MKTHRLFICAVLASAVAAACAFAQGTVGGDAANFPSQTVSPGNYGQGNYSPGAYSAGSYGPVNYGPGNYGPGNYGPGNYGPGAYGNASSTTAGVSPFTGGTGSPVEAVPATGQ